MRWHSSLLLVAILAACGGQPPPAPGTPAASGSAAPAADPGASSAPSTSSPAAAGPGGPAIESQREPFMQGCLKKVQAPDYCDCGFAQFKEIFKDVDMSHENPGDEARFKRLKERTVTNCASKLPEDTVKAGFLTGCSGGDSRKNPYCQCAWTSLRKTLSLADFLGDFQGDRFDDAKKALVLTCKGKFPEEVAKTEFQGACIKGDSAAAPTCTCIWKKLRAKYSTEEIAAGLADVKSTPGVDACSNK